MKLISSLLLFATAAIALGEPPKNLSPSRYNDVFRKSAFTDEPEPEIKEAEVSDLPDWTLVGVSKLSNQWTVTLLNTKNREERVTIPSMTANQMGFSILEVKYNPNYLKTEVRVKKGRADGWVVFDPQFLVLRSVGGPAGKGKVKAQVNTKNNNRNTRKRPPIPGIRTNGTTRNNRRTNTPPAPGSRTGRPPTPGARTRGVTSKKTTRKATPTRRVPRPSKK